MINGDRQNSGASSVPFLGIASVWSGLQLKRGRGDSFKMLTRTGCRWQKISNGGSVVLKSKEVAGEWWFCAGCGRAEGGRGSGALSVDPTAPSDKESFLCCGTTKDMRQDGRGNTSHASASHMPYLSRCTPITRVVENAPCMMVSVTCRPSIQASFSPTLDLD